MGSLLVSVYGSITAMTVITRLLLVYILLHTVTAQERELFSWTRGLRRAGGGGGKSDRSNGQQENPTSGRTVRTGYGYTRDSQEIADTLDSNKQQRETTSKRNRTVLENTRKYQQTQADRPRMSLASALDILKRNGGGLTQRNGGGLTQRNGGGRTSRNGGGLTPRSRTKTIQNINLRQSSRGRRVAEIIPARSSHLSAGTNAPGPKGYGYTRGSKEFLETKASPTRTVKIKTGKDQKIQLRQGLRGRPVPTIPPEYEYYDDYGEIYQDYDYQENYPEVTEDSEREEQRYRQEYDSVQEEEANDKENNSVESGKEDTDDGECGPECRNLLHELEHPKEHDRCPDARMVIDIWGYCRYIFHEERRDWAWWENMRTFVLGGGNSWYNSYRPTAYEEG